jgi:glycerate dehydrogenase
LSSQLDVLVERTLALSASTELLGPRGRMERHLIVFLDRAAVRMPLRPPAFLHQWIEHPHTQPEQVVARLRPGGAGATIAITNRAGIDEAVLEAVPELRLIAVSATGFDHVDVPACRRRGIAVCNVRDWTVSVPEHVFALILALRRHLLRYRAEVEQGNWARSATYGLVLEPMPRALAGSTLTLIGYGALGRKVERIGKAFGMRVLVAERKGAAVRRGRVAFEEAIAQAEVLVVLCPLTPATRNLVGAAELARMCKDALLVNCARGGIVDEAALAAALANGTIAGAATDVLAQEPPAKESPLLARVAPNLIVTPHMAWLSVESQAALAEQLIGNLEAWVSGAPRNLV